MSEKGWAEMDAAERQAWSDWHIRQHHAVQAELASRERIRNHPVTKAAAAATVAAQGVGVGFQGASMAAVVITLLAFGAVVFGVFWGVVLLVGEFA